MAAAPTVVPLPYARQEVERMLGPTSDQTLLAALRWMLLARALDQRMLALQRQGRVGFYGSASGQEAVNVAAGLATAREDWIVPGLREQLVALVRGHPLPTYVHHLFANAEDPGRGRNMPCHPTAREVHYVSMSSVIGTQIAHATGIGYGIRRRGEKAVAVAFFGDGATSANDFHAGLNFAAVLGTPVLFACTNNRWAISLPVERQTAAASLASKAAAYGFEGRPVDGTDLVACLAELRASLTRLRSGGPPEMIEFLLYRLSAHSSSDDPSRYQPSGWVAEAQSYDPVRRLSAWLEKVGLAEPARQEAIRAEVDAEVREAIRLAEATAPPPPTSLTEDVLAPLPSRPNGGPRPA